MEQKLDLCEALGNRSWQLVGPGLATMLLAFLHIVVNLVDTD